jgi:hypothetical protein
MYAESGGCGDLLLYALSADKHEVFVMNVDRKKLRLSIGESRRIDISPHLDGIDIRVEQYWGNAGDYCGSHKGASETPYVWKVTSGAIRVVLKPLPPERVKLVPNGYRAIVTLAGGAIFEGGWRSGFRTSSPVTLAADLVASP